MNHGSIQFLALLEITHHERVSEKLVIEKMCEAYSRPLYMGETLVHHPAYSKSDFEYKKPNDADLKIIKLLIEHGAEISERETELFQATECTEILETIEKMKTKRADH